MNLMKLMLEAKGKPFVEEVNKLTPIEAMFEGVKLYRDLGDMDRLRFFNRLEAWKGMS